MLDKSTQEYKLSIKNTFQIIAINIVFTIFFNWFTFGMQNTGDFWFSLPSLIIAIAITITFFINFEKLNNVNFENLIYRFIGARIICYIPFFLLNLFNLNEIVDYRTYYYKVDLVSDIHYIERMGEGVEGDYTTKEERSSFKYYVEKDDRIKNKKDKYSYFMLSKKSNNEYLVTVIFETLEHSLGETLIIEASPCLSKEIAYLKGYESLDEIEINYFSINIIVEFFKYILLKSGVYTLFCIISMLIIIKFKPHWLTFKFK